MTGIRRRLVAATAAVVLGAGLAGCDLDPRTAVLPGGVANGSDGIVVTAEFDDVSNLVPNSEVQYRDVRVGTVQSISVDPKTWRAEVRLSIEKKLHLPANIAAKIGQKSLLGALYVELDDPATRSTHVLEAGDRIQSTGAYPSTEDVLSSASLLLNYGGLDQLRTITGEVNQALDGREPIARDLITRLNTFVGTLNDQRDSLVSTVSRLNGLAGQLARGRDSVARALVHVTPAVATLNKQKNNLVDALTALNRLGTTVTRVVGHNKQLLATDLALLRPTLTKLASVGGKVAKSLTVLGTYPFAGGTAIKRLVLGDYVNIFVTLDLRPETLIKDFNITTGDLGKLADPKTLAGLLQLALGANNPFKILTGSGSATATSRTATPAGGTSAAAASGGSSASPSSTPSPSASPSPSPSPTCMGLNSVLAILTGGC